jgi:hypothetical protein
MSMTERLYELAAIAIVISAISAADWIGMPWVADDLFYWFVSVMAVGIFLDILCGGPPKDERLHCER